MIEIFTHSCPTCGTNAVRINRVKRHAYENNLDFVVHNSKYSMPARKIHAEHLKRAGFDLSEYHSIVVENATEVTRLELWKSSV